MMVQIEELRQVEEAKRRLHWNWITNICCGLKTVTAFLQTIVDGVFASIIVDHGVDKIGGIPLDDKIHAVFVQGNLV